MNKTLKYIVLILIFFIIGFLTRNYFFELSLSQLNKENIHPISTELSSLFFLHLLFSISMGSIPLLYLILEKLTQLKFFNQGMLASLLIMGSGLLLWQFQIFRLNRYIQNLTRDNLLSQIKPNIDFKILNFELFFFMGLLLGTGLSYLIFRKKK